MAATYMTDTEREQFYIGNIRMYARIIAKNMFTNCTIAVEELSKNQERLVNEFGYDWDAVEAIEFAAYAAAYAA